MTKNIIKKIFGFRKSMMTSSIAMVMIMSGLSIREVRTLSTISEKFIVGLHSVMYLK